MTGSKYPNDSLRQKLVIAGIPESEHRVDLLAAKMPEDFEPQTLRGMNADMMAELLLYFLTKGIVTLPAASESALLDLPWGSHVCQFFNAKDDLLTMLVPYFKQGLERNEACVWMVGELSVAEAKEALAAAVPGLDRYLATGQMKILHYSDVYTNPDGTVKAANALSDQFRDLGAAMAAEGYAGVRASGGMGWVNDAGSMARIMDFETKVNCAIQNSRMMAVCTYPAAAAALTPCRELIHNHGRIFVRRGTWVHDRSKEAQRIEAVFASLAGQAPPSARKAG